MQRLPVDSTDIVSIGYDAKARTLEIEFKENRIYQYTDVAPDIYEHFTQAGSYGEYFYAVINKHYRYKRIHETAEPTRNEVLALVTGNQHKLDDFRTVCEPFGIEVEGVDLPIDEIQSHDPERIVTHKVKQAYKLAGRPVVVQDTFWNILALRGFPGAYMHYVAEWFKPEDFLALMANKSDRTGIRTHRIAYYDGKRLKLFAKDFAGTIAAEPRGPGVSIEQLVITAGQTRTNAELRAAGEACIKPEDSAWHEFAKWYQLQRRMGKV